MARLTNAPQTWSDFGTDDPGDTTYRRVGFDWDESPPDFDPATYDAGLLLTLSATSFAGPHTPSLDYPRGYSTDQFTTVVLSGGDVTSVAFECTHFKEGNRFAPPSDEIDEDVGVFGSSVDLYVTLDPPLSVFPATEGDFAPPGGDTLVHSFTFGRGDPDFYGEQFTYDIPAGTTSVAFTLVDSLTVASWPAPGLTSEDFDYPISVGTVVLGLIPGVPGEPPPEVPEVADEFTPDAMMPEDPAEPVDAPAPQCATLLDLIKEFSGVVRRAVRLTGPTTIEMVDPNAPLPAGWLMSDAQSLYHSTSHELTAGASVLSLLAGDLVMEAGASLVTNDARILTSGWRIPDRLPVYGLDPAPVKRVNYTFSPQGFSASVEFHVPTVPLEARGL